MKAEELICRAALFAARAHVSQRRHGDGDVPYINHPLEVAHLVSQAGGSVEAICAAMLHDVIEDTSTTREQIVELFSDEPKFGTTVATIVLQHTNPKGLSWQDAKSREVELMTSGKYLPESRLVIVADQLANMQSLVQNPPGWGYGTERRYIQAMECLIKAATGTSVLLERMFQTAAIEARKFYGMT